MAVKENSSFTRDYLDPDKRSIANSLQIYFKDGTSTPKIIREYPLGHKRRREESYPHLLQKFTDNINSFPDLHHTSADLISLFKGTDVDNLSVSEFMAHFVPRTY
jgi:2-methylcitrate dehydratase